MSRRLRVYLEAGEKRTFAAAVEWPGWSRAGRDRDDALETLVAYGPRYRKAMGSAAADLELPDDVTALEVVERLRGSSGTDFGVPSGTPHVDERPVSGPDLARLTKLLEQSRRAVEKAATAAEGVELRKGPRGGGRDLEKILGHVLEADDAYLREFGVKHESDDDDVGARWTAVRKAMTRALEARVGGEPEPPMGRRTRPFWTPRYLVRRSAWHALDHAWEIEDRAEPATDDG